MSAPQATPADPTGGDAAVVWRLSARLAATHEDRATIDLRLERIVADKTLVPNDDISTERRLELKEGTEGVLDLVTGDEGRGQCASVAVMVGLRYHSPAYFTDAAISYDLWLVQKDHDGRETVERLRSAGRQGTPVEFFYPRLPYDVDGSRTRGTATPPLEMAISGRVTGSATRSGSVDVTLDAQRSFAAQGAAVATFGRKRLSVRLGETVEFEIPARVAGRLPGVGELSGPFGNTRTAIRLTPTLLWSTSGP